MPKLYTVTDWNPQPWYNTGGTRAKKYLQDPEGKYYYFKRSQFKPGKDYKFEFWSEIIAFELGDLLGFNVLRYDIAIDGEIMGCISESMINADKEELIEGIKYLQAFDNSFNPENVKQRYNYTFQLIEEALRQFELGQSICYIIEIILFDSIIGNGDRHQENWAFINEHTLLSRSLKKIEEDAKHEWFEKAPGLVKKIVGKFVDLEKKELNREANAAKLFLQKHKSPAPIYDNGSSLGRELTNERIERFLKNPEELKAYVNRGPSEIHWDKQKLSHFDLIQQLLNSSHCKTVNDIIQKVISRFDETKMVEIVMGIDNLVPDSHRSYKLPLNRKNLIINIITERISKLRGLIDA